MKPFLMRAGAALLAACCMTPLTAQAAAQIDPLYPDYDPAGEDSLTVELPAGLPLTVRIVQHSEERENLVLFENKFDASADDAQEFAYALEPGKYTIYAYMPISADGFGAKEYRANFTVENGDFIEQYDRTEMTFVIKTHAAGARARVSGSKEEETKDGVRYRTFTCDFPRSKKLMGDINGDGAIDMKDAMQVLSVAETEQMLFETADITEEQRLLADVDCDGTVTMRDAMQILSYWDDQNMGYEPEWTVRT